jgi:hypothetical protein
MITGVELRTVVNGMFCGKASPIELEQAVPSLVLASTIRTGSPATLTVTPGRPPHEARRIAKKIAASGRRDRTAS